MICLLLALEWGGSQYAWSSWRIILLLCVFAVATVTWAFVQWCLGDDATVPVRIVRNRSVAGALWFAFFIVGAIYGITQYVPIWFQAVKNLSAYQSGVDFIAVTAAMILAGMMSGFLVSSVVPFC